MNMGSDLSLVKLKKILIDGNIANCAFSVDTDFLIKKEGFNNTGNWLVNNLAENPEDAASLHAGIRELESFKDQLLVARDI